MNYSKSTEKAGDTGARPDIILCVGSVGILGIPIPFTSPKRESSWG